MKIYIFRPHENFNYCGGAIVVVARDFARAVEVGEAYMRDHEGERLGDGPYRVRLMRKDSDIHPSCIEKSGTDGTDKWVLEKVFDVGTADEWVFVHYNYA